MPSYTLPYDRFVRQVSSPLSSISDTSGIAQQAATGVQVAPWRLVAGRESAMPAHSATQTSGHDDAYDAYKFCGDYSAGQQRAYAACVAYRYRVPTEALTGTAAKLLSVVVPLRVDRWVAAGVRVAVYQSDSAAPPDTWSDIRDGHIAAAAQLPVMDPRVDQQADITLTLAVAATAKKFIYVLLTLENYADIRGYWIEGSARIIGGNVGITFNRSVTADAAWDGETSAAGIYTTWETALEYKDHNFQLLRSFAAVPVAQNIAAFGTNAVYTPTQFEGNTGAKIGVDTGGKVYGAISMRYIAASSSDAFRSLRFAHASLLPLSGKQVAFRLTLWSFVLPATFNIVSTIKVDYTGALQADLYRGAGSPSVVTFLRTTSGAGVDNAPVTLTKIGEATLTDIDYTSAHTFPVTISSVGVLGLIVCIAPVTYWGAVGTSTYATWRPGDLVYLK